MAQKWVEYATGTNAIVAPSRAAEGGRTHFVDRIIVSQNAGTPAAAVLTVTLGTSYLFTFAVPVGGMTIKVGAHGAKGAAVTASLAAGGASVVGRVTIIGHTE